MDADADADAATERVVLHQHALLVGADFHGILGHAPCVVHADRAASRGRECILAIRLVVNTIASQLGYNTASLTT